MGGRAKYQRIDTSLLNLFCIIRVKVQLEEAKALYNIEGES
jgi:hypothetical protein